MQYNKDEKILKIKENINTLVANGHLDEAKMLTNKYAMMLPDDVEVYSINAVIEMMKGNLQNAESILKEGLEKDSYNESLLFNMSYLMDNNKKEKEAMEYFSKAKLFHPYSDVKVDDMIPNRTCVEGNDFRVIHGTMEIANQMNLVTQGLNNIGVNAKSINYYPSYLKYDSGHTLDINSFSNINEANIKTKDLAAKIIVNNDVFHFHFGTSLTLDYSDLTLLKELGKKVVMQYWGSDVRMHSKAVKLNPYVKVKDMDEERIKRKLELISRYIPNCIVDYEVAEYVKDYHQNMHYSRVAIDLNKHKYIERRANKKLLIVHAPTSPEIKGTQYILKAIEDLKSKYDFDFRLVQGMKHSEALKVYEQADIIVDQILIGSYGVFAVEAMAMGKPVICWISDFMKEKYPKDLPIISANPDTIKGQLEYTIKNKDMLKKIGANSRVYVEKYHDMHTVSQNIMEVYKKL